jgi:hypothetical protein
MLYRITQGYVFSLDDVRSKMERCIPRQGSELRRVELWSGVSMFETATQAGRVARRNKFGMGIARLDVPDGHPMVVLSQPPSQSGHVTVWSCAPILASFYAGTMPIP